MFGSHATLVVVMASAIFGLCLGVKLPNMSLSNSKDVKFENCKNSNASSKVEFVKLSPCKHTPCVPRWNGTSFSLYIGFIPTEEVRRMHMKLEIGKKHDRWLIPFLKKWAEVMEKDNRGHLVSWDIDICLVHLANSSCPLKAGAPISIILPIGETRVRNLLGQLMFGMYQLRFSFLNKDGKPSLCFIIPVHMWISLYSDGLHLEFLLDSSICYFTDISSLFSLPVSIYNNKKKCDYFTTELIC